MDEHHRAVAAYAERWQAAQEAAWSVYRRARFADPDAIPAILTEVGVQDAGIADFLPAHWHARLFEEVIQGQIGSTFTYRRAVALFLISPSARPPAVYRALSAYLERRRHAAGPGRPWQTWKITAGWRTAPHVSTQLAPGDESGIRPAVDCCDAARVSRSESVYCRWCRRR